MKPKNINFVLYITIFIIFILTRINHIYSSQELIDIDFRGLAILSTGFPFGIIKNTTVYDFVSPIYYLIGHFFFTIFKTDIAIKVLNSIISLANIVFFIKIGKLLLNKNLGKLLAILLIINHFYLYYSNKIAPYSLTFLTGTILIYFLLLFLKRPKKENFKKLTIANCAYLLIDNLGFIYVICELLGLFAMFYKKKKYKQYTSILAYYCFITFLFIFPINIIQYSNYTKMLIPNSFEGIGVNLSSLYLTVNEFFSPFLSFITPETQSKTALGMLYYTFLNFDYKTINSLKIAFTLLYSSFLPLLLFLFSIIKSFRNYKLKLLFLISMLYFGTISFFALIQLIELNPIYFPQFFTTSIVILGYGIFQSKILTQKQ